MREPQSSVYDRTSRICRDGGNEQDVGVVVTVAVIIINYKNKF